MSIEIACVIMGLFGWVFGIYCGSKLNTKKKPRCKDCRAWSPRGGENGFCKRSPHRCKANESCENFERRKEE